MNQGISTIIYPVKDLARARELYGKLLNAEPYTDTPYYLGFRVGGPEIGFNPHGHDQGMTGPVNYWEVADIRQSVQDLIGSGAQAGQDVTDVGGGKLIATVQDPDGNVIGLVQTP